MNKKKLVIIGVALILFLLPKAAFASTLTLSPGGGNIPIKGTYSVQVRLNTGGEAVNAVSAFLSYPADKLEVAWISPGSAFAIEAEKSYGGGIIKISRGNISGVSGNVNVATIAFRGKSAGSASVAFIGGSAAPRVSDSTDSLSLSGSKGGIYTVVQQSSSTTSTLEDQADKQPPAKLLISEVKTIDIATDSATVVWKTNLAADSLVEYGLESRQYFLSSSNGQLGTDHSVSLQNPFLTPGLNLHFRVKSRDASGQEAVGEDQVLRLLGFQVRVKVTDEGGNPLSGVEVWLYSEPERAVTDSAGEAVFENVSPGKHLVVIKSAAGDKSTEIEVLPNQTSSLTTVKISQVKPTKSPIIIQVLIVAALVVVLVTILIVILSRRRKKGGPPQPSAQPPAGVTNPPINPNVTIVPGVPTPPNINNV